MKQLILHIPHSSILIPHKEGYVVDDDCLKAEMLKLTDWFTDDLFANQIDISVIAEFSRVFCDVERFVDDEQEVMAKFGMGVLYEKCDDDRVMRKVTPSIRKRILEEHYWPHHLKLGTAVKNKLEKYGKAMIIDCHSYSSIPFFRDLNQEPDRPDFCIGTDTFHTPQALVDFSLDFFRRRNFSVGINEPYVGTVVPSEHYKQNQNVNSLMLEINRKLYLKEPTIEKSENYLAVKYLVQEFLREVRVNFL